MRVGKKNGMMRTQSAVVTHRSETPSIFPNTAAPFQTSKRGSTSLGGGIICTFSILGTSGVAIACSLRIKQKTIVRQSPWKNVLPNYTCSLAREPSQECVPWERRRVRGRTRLGLVPPFSLPFSVRPRRLSPLLNSRHRCISPSRPDKRGRELPTSRRADLSYRGSTLWAFAV